MASTITRRPLPALVSLVALLALTALVWWRVLNRGHDTPSSASTSTPTCSTAPAAPVVDLPAPSAVTVAVLNSTERNGIAGTARSALLKDGFKSPTKAGNDQNSSIAQTAEIRYGKAGAAGAQLLSYYFPGAKLVLGSTTSATVTVVLGNAYKTVATPAAVNAALAKAKQSAAASASASASASC
jgi:hypothetical protein